jgi:hypothetical protein
VNERTYRVFHAGIGPYGWQTALFSVLRQASQNSDLIKEKIELEPIQINDSFGGYVMIICKYAVEVVWLILAVSACWVAGEQTGGFLHKPIMQDGFKKETHSPAQIRPPPWFG